MQPGSCNDLGLSPPPPQRQTPQQPADDDACPAPPPPLRREDSAAERFLTSLRGANSLLVALGFATCTIAWGMDQAIAAIGIAHTRAGTLTSSPALNFALPVLFRIAGVLLAVLLTGAADSSALLPVCRQRCPPGPSGLICVCLRPMQPPSRRMLPALGYPSCAACWREWTSRST